MNDLFHWMFFPANYPRSVSEDYLEYQKWDTLQGFMGYLKNIVLTLSFLKGIGVGDKDKDIESAMFIWILRDSTGVIWGLFVGMPEFYLYVF